MEQVRISIGKGLKHVINVIMVHHSSPPHPFLLCSVRNTKNACRFKLLCFHFVTAVASAFAAPTLLAVTVMESCDIYGVL